MPGNTLVVKIYQKLNEKSYQDFYIFYDHDIESYGVRGCRYMNDNIMNKFSFFFLDDKSSTCSFKLINFFKFVLNYENMYYNLLSLSLMNYPNLSLYSENITYDKLSSYNKKNKVSDYNDKNAFLPHEIMGYEYMNKEQMNEFQNDINNVLSILQNTWD